MADMSDRTNKHTSLTTFAERVMGRWSQTPMSATVQRAIRLTESTVSTPLTRATATEGFIQRVTQPKTTVAVWKPSATTKQTAIEGFTDALLQRFPDISAKYVARTEESAPAGQPELIHSSSTSVATGTEVGGSDKDSTGTGTSEGFDVNKLPSIPAEVLARHKAGLQRRAEASGTSPATAPAPRAVQRKSTPTNPQLVRPRSKVEYFGSKAETTTPVAPASALEPVPSGSQSTSTTPIQAKAEEPTIQETTPLEEPKWRTRPRAGFQSIPTRGTEGEVSPTVPYQPIQAQRSTPAERSEGSVESEVTTPPSSNTGTTAIQQVVDSTPIQADDGDDNDLTPPSGTTPPEGPPPPPAPSFLPPDTTLQRATAPETESPDMPLHTKPQATPPMESGTELSGESVLPSLTGAVPAKAIRRTSQTPPILRKPIVPSAPRPQATSASDTPVTSPFTRLVTSSNTSPSPIIDKGADVITPVQRQVTTSAPLQRVVASQLDDRVGQESVSESLYENQETPVSVDAAPSPISPALLGTDAPVQRQSKGDTAERIIAEPNPPTAVPPDPDAMPLRSVEASSIPTVQRQVAEENSAPVSIIETGNPPDTMSVSSSSASSVAAPRTEVPTVTPVSPDRPSSVIPTASAPVQRQTEVIQPTTPSLAHAPETNTNLDTPKVAVPSTNMPPVQRVTADPRQPDTNVPERDEMPLRAVESSHPAMPVLPVQPQEESAKADTSLVEQIDSSASPSTESPGTGIPVQRVVSDSTTPIAPSASTVSEVPQLPESSPTAVSGVTPSVAGSRETKTSSPTVPAMTVAPTDTAPVQRVAAQPATPEIPSRADMTLRVEDSPAPVQRKSESISTGSAGLDSSAVGSGTPAEPIAPVASSSNTTVAKTTALPTEAQSLPSSNEASLSRSEKSPALSTEPIQRVVADPPTLTVPTQADMPLRHEEAIPPSVVQRQVETGEPTSTATLSASREATQPNAGNTPQHDTGTAVVAQESQPIAPPVQRTVDSSSPTEPVQRVSAEISPASPTLLSTTDMPLRREESQGITPVQRQVATETGQTNSPSGEIPQLPLQRVTNEGTQTQTSNNTPLVEKDDNESTSQPPVQRKAADRNLAQVLSEATLHTDTLPSQPTLQRVGDDSETLELPMQRVSAEITPAGSALPTQADMPLRMETSEAVNTPTLQRVKDESSHRRPASSATPLEERGNTPPSQPTLQQIRGDSETLQIPMQRVSAEIAPTSPALPKQADMPLHVETSEAKDTDTTSVQRVSEVGIQPQPASGATPLGARGNTPPTHPNLQRAGDDSAKAQNPVQQASVESSTATSVIDLPTREANNSTPVQRASAEIKPPTPALPTQADMPLRVETSDTKDTASVQRVADESTLAQPVNDLPPGVRGESPASQAPVQRTANQGNQVQPSSDVIPFEKRTETSPFQPLQRMVDESSPAPLSNFVRVSGDIAPNAPTLPAQTDMPLRVNTGDVPSTPRLQRFSDDNGNSVTGVGEIESQSTGNLNGPAIQHEAVSPSNETIELSATAIPLLVEAKSSPDGLPIQRVIAEVTPATPANADMPLRHLESSGATPASANTSDTPPVQRVSIEASPLLESQVSQVQDSSSKLESPVLQLPVTATSVIQQATPSATPVSDTSVLSLNEPIVQRLAASIETTSPEIPTQADMPLRETTTSPLQRQAMPLESDSSTTEPSNPPSVVPLSEGKNRTMGNTQAGVPTLPTTQTARPLQRIVSHGGTTTDTPIQRKTAVKAAQIRRTATPLATPSAMPVTPVQRRASTTARFDNPTLASLALPTTSTHIESTGIEAESEAGLPLQRVPATPSPNPAMFSDAEPVRVLRRAPIAGTPSLVLPVQRVAVPTVPRSTEMPLVQRAEITETVVEPEEQQEVNIDLSSYFSDNNNASGDGNTEPEKTMGGTEKKAPTESDALKALQTLADEIYPLIKQMIARERERHRGF